MDQSGVLERLIVSGERIASLSPTLPTEGTRFASARCRSLDRDVLHAALGVVSEAAADWLAIVQGLLQRVEHEAGVR